MTIKETMWHPDPHTLAKHAILKEYLKAWLPIMSNITGRILYIDGFAGPGKYLDQDNQPTIDGSPLIAINAARRHRFQLNAEIIFLFIEARPDRCEYLKDLLSKITLPNNMRYEVRCSKFDETLSSILNYLEEQKKNLAPAFIFIDPFGYSNTPFFVVKRILENPCCEVLVTFMYGFIKRALHKSDQETHLDALFGTPKWKNARDIRSASERQRYLNELYKNQLENVAGIKYVRSFEMINKFNQTEYYLSFGTNNLKGIKEMKRAMWKADPTGMFQFSDRTDFRQKVLFEPVPNYEHLKNLILTEFKGKTILVEELEEFILAKTPYRETHYKKQILKPMEEAAPPEIEVIAKLGRRRGTYPPGTLIKFFHKD
jgi:three-Cys-motif partner protein